MALNEIVWSIAQAVGDSPANERIAYYGMWSALGVALIGGVFAVVKQWIGSSSSGTSVKNRRIVKEHEAFERFLLLNGFEARRIKTGYESPEEVRRVLP